MGKTSLAYKLKNFQKKHRKRIVRNSSYLLFFSLALFLLKDILFLILLTAATGIVAFIINRLRVPFDLSPIFFGSVIIMHFYGVWHVMLFLLFASIIPSVLAGSVIDFISILSLVSILLVSFLVAVTTLNFPYVLILIVLYAVVASLITFALSNELGKALATFIVLLSVNIAYFIALSKPILAIGNIMIN
ncbi:hypothetical protein CMO88_02055 [Candidatus Woesearchaeota archaeon]|nr:hypothetical protein [Candidatus Woesearchaeota archaeon]|tara:strand:- start:11234 stop:11803 length:570 start_codon:yes stop_codon:yes gene_type:complete